MPLPMLERREQLRRDVDAILASERGGALTRTSLRSQPTWEVYPLQLPRFLGKVPGVPCRY